MEKEKSEGRLPQNFHTLTRIPVCEVVILSNAKVRMKDFINFVYLVMIS